jgi:hypothetical protein
MFQPVGNHAAADLFGVPDLRMVMVDIPEYVEQGGKTGGIDHPVPES